MVQGPVEFFVGILAPEQRPMDWPLEAFDVVQLVHMCAIDSSLLSSCLTSMTCSTLQLSVLTV